MLIFTGVRAAFAQQFTIAADAPPLGANTAPLRTAPDYATDVLSDPWDFDQASDYVYMFSTDAFNADVSAWASIPTVSGGRFSGVSQVARPRVWLLYQGQAGSLNVVGRNGVRFPIDSNKYRRLSFRLRRSQMPADWFWPIWATQTNLVAGMGTQVAASKGFDTRYHAYLNQSAIAQQQNPNEWHIYKIDLDSPVDPGQTPWTAAAVRGLAIDFGDSSSLVGATIDLDWVRLTERGVALAQLNFSGFGGAVTVTAKHTETQDVIQIFPDNGTAATTFSDNSSYTWDYGFLPPGTWTVTATGNGHTVVNTFVVDPAPYVNVMEPDEKGGRDFARTIVGDAYDMTNAEDVSRDGSTQQLTGVAFGESGMTATSVGANCVPGIPCADPFVAMIGAYRTPADTRRTLDATTYRHLTFTLEYDHKELTFNQALGELYGGIARVIWESTSKYGTGLYANTQDIFLLDGGPYTYSMDLGSFTDIGDCNTCQLEVNGVSDPWQGSMSELRIDPYESNAPRWFRLADVRIAADDEPNGNGYFAIRWQVRDATFSSEVAGASPGGSDATIALYYDTDTNATNGRAVIATVPASSGIYNWNVAGLAVGRYYIYATVTDGAGNSQSRYSTGPMAVASIFAPPTDTSGTGMPDAWRARYDVTDPSADPDNDGVNNLTEYQQGTNPLVSNTWMLPEGATGFFTERVALVNPDPSPANVTLTFLRKTVTGQPPPAPIVRDYTVLGYGRLTVTANEVAGLSSEEFSTVISSTSGGVLPERTMFWGDQWYGGHTGKAVQSAKTRWYLAEGNAGFFQTWILLANATGSAAHVQIRYLLPGGGTIDRGYVVDANSRYTVFANAVTGLEGKSFSSDISSDVAITVERAMYFGDSPFWAGGHVAAAVDAPALEWFVAEGRTGNFFDTFVLLANPNATPADINVRYLLPGGVYHDATYTLAPYSRNDLWLNAILKDQYGLDDTDVSARINSTNGVPIIVERAMYWAKPGWYESHGSAGVTSAGTLWALSEGELGGSRVFDTYVLLSNSNSSDASVKITVLRQTGAATTKTVTVPANSRVTYQASMIGAQSGEQFGFLFESLNNVPIVVERSMYWNGGGVFWGGGSNETGFKLR